MVEIIDKFGKPVKNPNNPDETLHYYISKRMIAYLESVKSKINKKDKDYVLIIDGYEGSGKSTLAMQIGKYVDPDLNLDRICLTSDEFKQAIINAKKGQCVIYDEAVTGMAAGESITRIGRLLKSMMMQMRQKNLFVIIVIPAVFDLNKYAVLSRARALFHVYERKDDHKWVGYNKKDLKMLYLKGKKTYSYRVRSFFTGIFRGKFVVNEEKYRKKKEEALFLMDSEANEGESRWKKQRDVLILGLIEAKWTHKQIQEWLERYKLHLSMGSLSEVRKKYGKQAF